MARTARLQIQPYIPLNSSSASFYEEIVQDDDRQPSDSTKVGVVSDEERTLGE